MVEPNINIIAIVVAALIPNILGALYYGPLFGKTWMKSMNKTSEEMKHKNEAVVYITALVMGFIVSFFMNFVMQFLHKDVNSAGELIIASHNTFGHGAFHGALLALAFVMPVIVSLGLFHKSSVKNILLNVAFWILSFAVMGGILDVWT